MPFSECCLDFFADKKQNLYFMLFLPCSFGRSLFLPDFLHSICITPPGQPSSAAAGNIILGWHDGTVVWYHSMGRCEEGKRGRRANSCFQQFGETGCISNSSTLGAVIPPWSCLYSNVQITPSLCCGWPVLRFWLSQSCERYRRGGETEHFCTAFPTSPEVSILHFADSHSSYTESPQLRKHLKQPTNQPHPDPSHMLSCWVLG